MKIFLILFASTIVLMTAWPSPAQTEVAVDPTPYAGGSPNAPVKIEVFSDYQCPACRRFYLESIRQVLIEYSRDNRVCVVYHDFPIQNHRYSAQATRYALAARRLGRAPWLRVVESLYADQSLWIGNGNIEPVVARALSPEEFEKIKLLVKSPEVEKDLEEAISLAQSRSIQSTPTFFITAKGKEQRVVGGVSYQILKYYLDQLLR